MDRAVDELLAALGYPKGSVDRSFPATRQLPVVMGIGDGGGSSTARHTVDISNTVLTKIVLAIRARRLPILCVRLREGGTTKCCVDAACRAAHPDPDPVYGVRSDGSTCWRVVQCGHCGSVMHRDVRAVVNMVDSIMQIILYGSYHLPSFLADQRPGFAP